jgi:ABC-type branched-subunit amino acid transport system permease subunit
MMGWKNAAGVFLLALIVFFVPKIIKNDYDLIRYTHIGLHCIIVIGLSLFMGYAGQISLGQAGFYAIGAYTTGILATKYGLPPFATVFIGIVFAALAALVIGIPSLRLHGHYLAMATLGFCFIFSIVSENAVGVVGGVAGITDVPAMNIPYWYTKKTFPDEGSTLTGRIKAVREKGKIVSIIFTTDDAKVWNIPISENSLNMAKALNLRKAKVSAEQNILIIRKDVKGSDTDAVENDENIYEFGRTDMFQGGVLRIECGKKAYPQRFYLTWITLIILMALSLNIMNSRVGRACKAIHSNPTAASAMGINTSLLKTQIFVISAIFASIAGSYYASFEGYVPSAPFTIDASIHFVILVAVGGMTNLWCALFGAIFLSLVFIYLEINWDFFKNYKILFDGAILMLIMMFFPKGLFISIGEKIKRLLALKIFSKKQRSTEGALK